ncbi:MAG: hypothetical protein IPK16_18655 [Anaerolineales bacterium]|nr:hypothetical protein [Anaerolineales bacterium]
MNRIIYRQSVASAILGIVLFSATIVISLYYGISRNDLLILCFLGRFFTVMLGLLILALKDRSPKVILDDEGIGAKEWGWIRLNWVDIHDVKVISIPRGGVSITLEPKDDAKYLAGLSRGQRVARQINKRFYGQPFSFLPTALDASTERIYAEIKRHLRLTVRKNTMSIDGRIAVRAIEL